MKVRLNLATVPMENQRRFLAGALLVGVLGLVAFALLSRMAYQNWRENIELRQELAVKEAEIRQFQQARRELDAYFNDAPTRRLLDRTQFLNGLIERRGFPWTQVFMDLERLLPPGVRVRSIAPRLDGNRVEVQLLVGARSDEDKLRFLRTLESSGEFSRVQLLGEKRATRGGQDDPVQIELVAWYAAR